MKRISKYKPSYCKQLIEFLSEGGSITAFAASINIERQTFYDWVEKHPEFRHAKEIGYVKSLQFYENILREHIDGKRRGIPIIPLIFLMKCRFRDEYHIREPKIEDSLDKMKATVDDLFKALKKDGIE